MFLGRKQSLHLICSFCIHYSVTITSNRKYSPGHPCILLTPLLTHGNYAARAEVTSVIASGLKFTDDDTEDETKYNSSPIISAAKL